MICVEVGHLYVGDDPETLLPAIAAYRAGFPESAPLLMIDDYSRPCVEVEAYVATVETFLLDQGLRAKIVKESALISAAETLMARLGGKITSERFRGKSVHFFLGDQKVKVAETRDGEALRFSCAALVAALTLTRVETWGATRLVSILPEMYRDNEKAADALTAAFGMSRELILI